MKSIYITATDTDAGKTIVTGLFAAYLKSLNINVITQKWIQTGANNFSGDIQKHWELMGTEPEKLKDFLYQLVPYSFSFPGSPHLAANLEQKQINPSKIINAFHYLQGQFESIIVEGVGGVLVPYDNENTVLDIACELSLPVILVIDNKLGAINHALMSIDSLKSRGMSILGMIFNQSRPFVDPIISKDNIEIIKTMTGVPFLGELPHCQDYDELKNRFIPIGDKILAGKLKGGTLWNNG